MAAVTWPMVVAFASELADPAVDPLAQADILEYVNTVINAAGLGGEDSIRTKLARINLAAHMGTRAGSGAGGGSAGQILSETVGPMTRAYAKIADLAGSLASTPYGAEYDSIIKSAPGLRGPVVAGGRT